MPQRKLKAKDSCIHETRVAPNAGSPALFPLAAIHNGGEGRGEVVPSIFPARQTHPRDAKSAPYSKTVLMVALTVGVAEPALKRT